MIDVVFVIECLDLDTKKCTLSTEFWTNQKEVDEEVEALNFLYRSTDTDKLAIVRTFYNLDLREARTLEK